jgi:hypothetical protein
MFGIIASENGKMNSTIIPNDLIGVLNAITAPTGEEDTENPITIIFCIILEGNCAEILRRRLRMTFRVRCTVSIESRAAIQHPTLKPPRSILTSGVIYVIYPSKA